MNAIHINWTRPFFARGGTTYSIEDFELVTTILSALKWREKNGSIKMITDHIGADYYASNGMAELWDGGIETALEDIADNPNMFWAAGKLHSLGMQKAPIAVLDTDFIVWEEILFEELGALTVIHDEPLYPDVYPNVNAFRMKSGYRFDPSWDWRRNALNTAFFVIQDQGLLDYYVREALYFMEYAEPRDDPLRYMVFAEQRLLSMCAGKYGAQVSTFSNLERLFRNGDGWFTHIWGMKQQMRDIPLLREEFCRRCIGRILKDYPDAEQMISQVENLRKYLRK